MLEELLIRDIEEMDPYDMVEECRELEDAYAEALKDNAGFDALSKIWKRIKELHQALEKHSIH
jgi:hypothetical protein